MMECDFSIAHWQAVLRQALEVDYRFYTCIDWLERTSPGECSIVLRHDIDVSPELALRQAETEAELGIRATYFIRLHSRFYNPRKGKDRDYIGKLGRLDVEIGLHYETGSYQDSQSPAEVLAEDARLLTEITGKAVKGCSAHRVSTFPSLDAATINDAGLRYDAFSPDFVERRKYISDSSRRWREGCLCRWLGRAEHLTVLTHPIWWFQPAGIRDNLLERIRQGD